ncbi:RmlC-like cupin domain-containing protein [Mycena rosella]|uniref:RmlC-like cupin domain-containing protein n=1 Tax=Mycena rosella TaxID=1033263 RepID=A0AAD7CTC7_MYCRO|nr:RmlC-like cupin domain-containing protein [Mycena rosella]
MGIRIVPRVSQERGNADHGWLKTFHTFSPSSHHGRFGALRILNEDRVASGTGFGTHSHREFEIFSYIVSGQLAHKDSMGNVEVLKRGDLQLTSAGTGISHSENAHGATPVHFLQIWALPSTPRLQPKYFTRHFTDDEKRDIWARVVAPVDAEGVLRDTREGKGPAPVQSTLSMYATLLSGGKRLTQPMRGSKGYIHVVQTSGYNIGAATGAAIKVFGSDRDWELKEGDGAYIHFDDAEEFTVDNVGDMTAEILLFAIE